MSTHSDMVRMYHTLEKETNDLGSTIHFDHKNFNTFGLRVYNLFFLTCNLFEHAAKEIERNPDSNMGDWKRNSRISSLSGAELTFRPVGFRFKPLMGLGNVVVDHRKLSWWDDYNTAKHDLSLSHATLKNLIYALGSAGILVEIAVHPGTPIPTNPSILFDGVSIPDIY